MAIDDYKITKFTTFKYFLCKDLVSVMMKLLVIV